MSRYEPPVSLARLIMLFTAMALASCSAQPDRSDPDHVFKTYLDRYEVQVAGGNARQEYWIPAADIDNFNAALIGDIQVKQEFR